MADLFFNPGRRLRIQTDEIYLLWISWGWRAEIQFTINRGWIWSNIMLGNYGIGFRFQILWFSYTRFK